MRRFALSTLVLMILFVPAAVHADEPFQNYRSDELGLALQYPAGWEVREQVAARTITAASRADLEALDSGKPPSGLLFTVSVTSFRQGNVTTPDDFATILKQIAASPDSSPTAIRIGGADGLFVDTQNAVQDVAARTAVVSIGRRRMAIIRGVSTVSSWLSLGEARFNDLTAHLSFFVPANRPDQDEVGRVLWQVPADHLTDLADISLNLDGSAVYVTDHVAGIWTVTTNGVGGDIYKPDGIGDFAGISVRSDGVGFVADPVNHALWAILPATRSAPISVRKFAGEAGTKLGQFGSDTPRVFTFGYQSLIYALDKGANGVRVQIIDHGGVAVNSWNLDKLLSDTLDSPQITSDSNNFIYVIARNHEGIIKINVAGAVISTTIGKDALAGIEPLALAIDRFGNFYVATPDQGILKLDKAGTLQGVIGEAYDEAAPPKPGQLGHPVAMTIESENNLMYVADSGRYPQVVAFALSGNTMVNRAAGTKSVGSIGYGSSVNGIIDARTFVYTYTFDGKAGDVVTITMKADDNSPLDSYVELLGPQGTKLAANDDAKSGDLGKLDAQIVDYRLPVTGTYTIITSRFGAETASGGGAYSLSLDRKDSK